MKTSIRKILAGVLALGLCLWSAQVFAQMTTTAVTTANGNYTQYVPGSETVVVKSETSQAPVRYVVTKQTTVVDEAGAPVTWERIPAGSPLAIQYTGTGDRLVASRIVVQRAAPVTAQQTTTTATTTRPLSWHEKHELKRAEERRHHEAKERIEHSDRAVEKTTIDEH